ncbi:jg16984 [Pararge aegeria aegeria]|uniref:Jg16984 protein n=2 Tax=Pararge aegeria TaxID=116150 RepID=A0A8S4RL52_9NEOP|nr:jg16984 [Pararge aegeria aegeria]
MRSLSNRHQLYQGPPPVNLLEKQFQLITRSCVEPSVCARAAHNADKNRPGGILPSDPARVMLVPKPGVEGSEYVNASWVCGRRRMREYAVAQHPGDSPELWRLLWDHTAQLVLLLADNPNDPDCDVFWPTEEENELFVANFRASFVSKHTYVASMRSERKAQNDSISESETNGYRRTEGSECADNECLIPENSSPVNDSPEPAYRFDRTELRLERLSGNRDLSARKSIANGDLFSSLSEKKNGPRSPRSPSKMSLKNFKLSSPTKFKFPEWGSRTAGSPPDTAPPPPPIAPSLTVPQEAELRRPVYVFETVDSVPDVSPDKVIEVTNVSVHSLQDDYQLSVKFIKCSGWLDGRTSEYLMGRPDDNECVRGVRQASCESEREKAIDRLIAPFQDSFALIEFVAASQMEFKNGPVVVVDKYGGWRALTFCSLSAACGGVRNPAVSEPGAEFAPPCTTADLYCSSALNAHARCAPNAQANHCASPGGSGSLSEAPQAHSPRALLAAYSALAAYAQKLPRPDS